MLDVVGQQEAIGALTHEHVEVIDPEVHHHFLELPLGHHGPHHGELLEFPRQAAPTQHLGRLVGRVGPLTHGGVGAGVQLPLAARALLVEVGGGEVLARYAQQRERALALCQEMIVEVVGIELLVDPAQRAHRREAIDVAGPRAVREPIEGVECGIAGGERLSG